ncbi:hypothetical protein AX774_g5727 [Zancudomyces culisetae]|uniref:Uncharacterized protein n=1 Tax=Zancudomyces culisetae TaxID=1213189 RepID=A0A1R1PIT0_ZANCU|nr:hypothetical protein AX774_g5727 [Zancudomyces culisetae]|eukprot:OMH80829.1 hypothetical protein AX774_g5727 [Zancudomyces culisetae]
MAEPWSFQTEFGHYVYPVLGIYSDTIAEMKSEYGRRVARTLVDHFTTFKTDDTFDKAPKTKELEQLWYPVRRNWKVVDLKDVIQKKKDLTKEKGMILHSSWIEKFQNLPSVTISFYELDDEQAIVEKIKKIIENSNVLHTVVVILDQKQYETYGTDARLSHICKESGIDMHHLAVSRPGNREYIEEFLNGLELGLRTDAILYYSGRIAEKQQKLADLINLDARNDIQPRFQNDRERDKSADREKDSNAVTTGKLVRQYLKLSYFAECSEDNETKKHYERYQSKEAESNTDVGVSGDTDTPTENDVLDKAVYKEWEKSAKTLEFTKNKDWIEGINVMNTLCLRMEREAIKEKQESPRSQHLENFRQLLELSGIDTNHVCSCQQSANFEHQFEVCSYRKASGYN